MDLNKPFYVKSLEEGLTTQRLADGIKKPFQSIEEMIKPADGFEPRLNLNTVSFGQADRLACTVLNDNYTQTYRPQGIIFQTDLQPDYVSPFDLMVLANVPGEKILSDYYKIVNELKEHYERALIPGYKKFLFRTPEEMFAVVPNPEVAWQMVNEFRKSNGLSPVRETEKKLVMYNEVIFHKTVPIEPVAIFGENERVPRLQERAQALGLEVFSSAQDFYFKIKELKSEKEKELQRGAVIR